MHGERREGLTQGSKMKGGASLERYVVRKKLPMRAAVIFELVSVKIEFEEHSKGGGGGKCSIF